jgi:hypothetical protein
MIALKHFAFTFLMGSAFVLAQQAVQPTKDLSGFSGYAWGTSREFIQGTMEDDGYDLIENGINTLWYRGKILNEKLQIVYRFEKGRLQSGMWIVDKVDPKTYWKINEHLRNAYNSKVRLKIQGDDWIEAEMEPKGTDAWIIHKLDVKADRHVVHYYYRRGEE